jgi:hypothetical protein
MRDPRTENYLTKHGYVWQFIPAMPLADIDWQEADDNPCRVTNGTPRKNLAGLAKGIDDKNSPLCIDTLHNYVHNRFYSPSERELKVSWDNSQLFFVNIWQ